MRCLYFGKGTTVLKKSTRTNVIAAYKGTEKHSTCKAKFFSKRIHQPGERIDKLEDLTYIWLGKRAIKL